MVPYYPDKASKDYQWMDIYNALGRTRTLFVGRYLDDENCNQLIASLVWLQGESPKEPITMYFNVPGAAIKPALAVFDVMMRMKCPIITINMGLTCGMGAVLCAAGSPGQRYCMPNARFLMGRGGLDDGIQGQASTLKIMVQQVMDDNTKMIGELARLTGQPVPKLTNDLKREFYLTAPEAAAYGVVDQIKRPTHAVKMMKYRGMDDDVIGFGHFSEARRVKESADDIVKQAPVTTGSEHDEYAASALEKKMKDGRIDPASLRNGGGANRFANSRCRPISIKKEAPPKVPGGDDEADEFTENPFKNTGW